MCGKLRQVQFPPTFFRGLKNVRIRTAVRVRTATIIHHNSLSTFLFLFSKFILYLPYTHLLFYSLIKKTKTIFGEEEDGKLKRAKKKREGREEIERESEEIKEKCRERGVVG
jgi:hypothetical protein